MSDDRVLLDEFHVSVYVPADLPEREADALRAALATQFARRLLAKAVHRAVRRGGFARLVAVRW